MSNELTATPSQQLAITEAQFAILTQATQAGEIRYRTGKGGRQFPYTDSAYVIRTLNLAFGWNWDFEADNEEIFYANGLPFEAKVRGRLTVRNGGTVIIKTQFGCQPIEYLRDSDTPVSMGDALKGAGSDALKKCASLLGVALDLYDSDSDINTGKRNVTVGASGERVKVKPPTKTTNGKKEIDPMTRFWQEVKAAGLTREKGLEILAAAENNPSRAIDILNGMAQA
jgi:hypothetical protein